MTDLMFWKISSSFEILITDIYKLAICFQQFKKHCYKVSGSSIVH